MILIMIFDETENKLHAGLHFSVLLVLLHDSPFGILRRTQ